MNANMEHLLHWRRDRSFNFGDRLSPIIYRHLSGVSPKWVREHHSQPFMTMAGSFLEVVGPRAVVWGTGLLKRSHTPQPRADYRAVRGPHTRERILAAGGTCPEIYGDPVLLLPEVFPPSGPGTPQYLGIAPHFRERRERLYSEISDPKVLVLDVTDDPSRFVRQLQCCELLATSSLHALVAAHAYGIPAAWIQPTALPLGDGLKFHDYLDGVGVGVPSGDRCPSSPLDLVRMASQLAVLPSLDLTAFRNACPILN